MKNYQIISEYYFEKPSRNIKLVLPAWLKKINFFDLLGNCKAEDIIFIFNSLQEILNCLHCEANDSYFYDDFDCSKKFLF